MSTSSTVQLVEYVTEGETLADITTKDTTTASLRTSNAILLALLLLSAYILNTIIIATVLVHKKLRTTIYILFCHFSAIHMIDLSFTVMLSLVFVANESWVLGMGWCRANATIQEFCQLYTIMSLMLMAAERAIGLITMYNGPDPRWEKRPILGWKKLLIASSILAVVSIAISIPSATQAIPVKPFANRYLCAVAANCPIAYPISRIIIFIGCLCVTLVCAGAILKKRNGASLPSQTREYSEFIKKNRAAQELQSRAKLVVFLLIVFLLIEGPYITLSFVYEVANSKEALNTGPAQEIPQDADILLTWLKFVFPLLSPIIILSWCSDIWLKVKELFCCQSYDPPTIGHYMGAAPGVPGVMTLVATPEGLQLRMPAQSSPIFQPSTMATIPPATQFQLPPPEPRELERRPAPVMQNAQTNTTARSNPQSSGTSEARVTHAGVQSEPGSTNNANRTTRATNQGAIGSRIPKPSQTRATQPNKRKSQPRRVKPTTTARR